MADNKKSLAALLKAKASGKKSTPSRISLDDSASHDTLSYQQLALQKQQLQYNQPTASQFVKDPETRLMIEAINKKLNLLYKELETVEQKENEDESELDTIEEYVEKDKQVTARTERHLADATKSMDKMSSYVANITENIQNIADKMGAYVTTLKETREALQDEREATAPKEAKAEAKMSLGEFFGSMKGVSGRGGILGVLGKSFLQGAGKSVMKNVVKPVAAAAGSAAKSGASAIMKLMKNPKVLVLALVAAIGTGIYKYFTDDKFKESVSDFFSKALDMGKEYILKPIMNMFGAMKEGMYNLIASIFETYASISIPVPEFMQKLGLPATLKPYGFLKGAAQDLRTAAADSKAARDAANAPKAAAGGGSQPPSEGAAATPISGGGGGPDASPASPGTAPVAAAGAVAAGGASAGDEGPAIVKVIEVGKGYNVVELSDGSVVRREGAWNWRNNNPGNMTYNAYTRSLGALEMPPGADPAAARYAIFPTYAAGRAAKAALLFSGKNYKDLLLSDAIARWAPPNENDTKKYQQTVIAAAGGQDVRMGQLNEQQRQAVLSTMEKVEGYKKGKVTVVKAGSGKPAAGAAPGGPAAAAVPTPPTIANAPREDASKKEIKTDSSLAKAAPSATGEAAKMVAAAPTTGQSVTEASTAVQDLKMKSDDKDVAVVDASKNSESRAGQIMNGGGIPSPIANRGSIDRFNFFTPPGFMKLA